MTKEDVRYPRAIIYPCTDESFCVDEYGCDCPYCNEYFSSSRYNGLLRSYLVHLIMKHWDEVDQYQKPWRCTLIDTRPEVIAKQKALEEEKKRKDKIKRIAIKKLTKEEREVLGITVK